MGTCCQHERKVYASGGITLTCYPPINISSWICRDCGEEGTERTRSTIDDEYNEVKSKFGKGGNITNTP